MPTSTIAQAPSTATRKTTSTAQTAPISTIVPITTVVQAALTTTRATTANTQTAPKMTTAVPTSTVAQATSTTRATTTIAQTLTATATVSTINTYDFSEVSQEVNSLFFLSNISCRSYYCPLFFMRVELFLLPCTAKVCLHGYVVTQMGDAIFYLLK